MPTRTYHIGQIVVVGGFVGGLFSPISHNSGEFPKHPCRGRVLKIGTKYIHISTRGTPWKVLINNDSNPYAFVALTPEEAKPLYRAALESYAGTRAARSPAFIDECVESL